VALAVIAAVVLGSPKDRIPVWEWAMAVVGALSALYLFVFYDSISDRVGAPITQDFVVAVIGLMLLLEATRRALGPALKAEMLELVRELLDETSATLLMVSHDPQDARVLCDQVVLVADGQAHAPVATDEMFANPPEVMREYLGA